MKIDVHRIKLIAKAYLVDKKGNREICRDLNESSATVSRYCKYLDLCCLSYGDLSELNDHDFLIALKGKSDCEYIMPDFEEIERFYRRNKKITLEKAIDAVYFSIIPEKNQKLYSLAHVYDLFSQWNEEFHGCKKISSVPCNPGDYLEIDFAGDDLHWINPEGLSKIARVFVSAFKYSNIAYGEAFENEKVTSWLKGTVHVLDRYGVPKSISLDNAKALVNKPDKFVGELSFAMQDLCLHYQMIPNPCKVKKPTYKNVTEYSVNLVETCIAELEGVNGAIFARDLADVNRQLQEKIDKLNNKAFVEEGRGSRTSCYEQFEKKYLKAPPLIPFDINDYLEVKVDGHGWVKVENKRYLAHYSLRGKKAVVVISSTQVSIYNPKDRILCCSYERDFSPYYASHKNEDMLDPVEKALTKGLDETINSFKDLGYASPIIVKYLTAIFNEKFPTLTTYKRVMGLKGLIKTHGLTLIEKCCHESDNEGKTGDYLRIKELVHDTIKNVNKNGGRYYPGKSKDKTPDTSKKTAQKPASTEGMKLRGADYYKGGQN